MLCLQIFLIQPSNLLGLMYIHPYPQHIVTTHGYSQTTVTGSSTEFHSSGWTYNTIDGKLSVVQLLS